ncbi:phosphatase PAP2 family protein [Microbacterium barkeri]|uniref:phosphatase PAP2 family protein n=1 Tax=Microbacterium barkeri TaxID=33917 RepID=UPI0024AEA729|nr:phosphatase PAP2 family protein [Microbacterium barkeri]MDI6944431.1 phosphatase PAP2 family protein [Microbacterium barkeri]
MPSAFPRRKVVACAVLLPLIVGPAFAQPAFAAKDDDLVDASAIEPRAAAYGAFVDTYRQNTTDFTTPETNPAIGVLSEMLEYWTPGTTWNDGTVLNAQVHEQNIAAIERITQNRTDEEADAAYLADRRHQSYSMIEGLEEDAQEFRDLANAGTTIPDEIPADALTTKYDDRGNENGAWADVGSELGSVVQLVNTVRGPWATSNRAKEYYQYMRPFRWSDDVVLVPELEPVKKPESEAASDGGFPSGHTNAAFLAGIALATAVPEHYDDLLLQASDLGYSRAEAGMHSALDIIGGRILATGLAAATLADDENAGLIAEATADADTALDAELDLDTDRDAYQARLAEYLANTTFGLDPVGEAGVAPVVPEGAEELIRTRYPYLDDAQLRWVLYSTALESGLPVADDAEGWGRLNLFAAANGFGAFDRDVAVSLDATADGYGAVDVWRNDIDGAGSLTLDGTGTLILAGENSFTGGVRVKGGELVATTATALGTADVELQSGVVREQADGTLEVGGELTQKKGATLALTIEDASAPALSVDGKAKLRGTLAVDVSALAEVPAELPLIEAAKFPGALPALEVTGLPEGYQPELRVEGGVLTLVDAR